MQKVNLDALIPREDFEAEGINSPSELGDTLSISSNLLVNYTSIF